MKKGGISAKKNQKVSGPGLYKRILLVQMRPTYPTSVEKCAALLLGLLFVTLWMHDKHGQM